MLIAHISPAMQIPIKDLIGHQPNSTLYIHVAKGPLELAYARKECGHGHQTLDNEKTYRLTQRDTENTTFSLRSSDDSVVAFDITEPLPDDIYQNTSQSVNKYEYTPPSGVRNRTYSYLRNPMTLEEIRSKILFMDIECAMDGSKQLVPVSIAVQDYYGRLLMRDYICPRQWIENYQTKFHGITERDLIGTIDGEQIKGEVKKLLKDKVLIGHDLRLELKALNINIKDLAGVRDLQGCLALKRIMPPHQSEWKLTDVARRLDIKGQSKQHSAAEDVRIIREVYLKIESTWQDTPREIIDQLKNEEDDKVEIISRLKSGHENWLKEKEKRKRAREEEEAVRKRAREEGVESAKTSTLQETPFIPPQIPREYLTVDLDDEEDSEIFLSPRASISEVSDPCEIPTETPLDKRIRLMLQTSSGTWTDITEAANDQTLILKVVYE